MPKLIKKRSEKAGLPPGTLVHIGEKRAEIPKITIMDYSEAHFQEKEVKTIEECFHFKETPTVTWINIDGLHQVEILEKLGECYGFHPLVLEDILNTDQRPKIEDYGEYSIKKKDDGSVPLGAEEERILRKLLNSGKEIILEKTNYLRISSAISGLKQYLHLKYEKMYFVKNIGYFISGILLTADC